MGNGGIRSWGQWKGGGGVVVCVQFSFKGLWEGGKGKEEEFRDGEEKSRVGEKIDIGRKKKIGGGGGRGEGGEIVGVIEKEKGKSKEEKKGEERNKEKRQEGGGEERNKRRK